MGLERSAAGRETDGTGRGRSPVLRLAHQGASLLGVGMLAWSVVWIASTPQVAYWWRIAGVLTGWSVLGIAGEVIERRIASGVLSATGPAADNGFDPWDVVRSHSMLRSRTTAQQDSVLIAALATIIAEPHVPVSRADARALAGVLASRTAGFGTLSPTEATVVLALLRAIRHTSCSMARPTAQSLACGSRLWRSSPEVQREARITVAALDWYA